MEDNRAAICHIKATTLLPNVLCLEQARAQGAQETILVKDNYVTEAASSNVFMVSNNIIRTTPTTANILSGITRKIVIQLARNNGIVVEECNFTVDELLRAEEIWLTSSTREIAPVIKINQLAVGDARPGPLWQRIDELFQQYKIN